MTTVEIIELGNISFTSLSLLLIVLTVARGGADSVEPWQDGFLHSVGVTVVEELHLPTETDCKFIPNALRF